jgi:amidophosphoribosyltransferase
MSDPIHHECGIAYVRLRKKPAHYQNRYGTALWGFEKLFLLLHKQRNRGQDGAGIGCGKIGVPHGERYFFHDRTVKPDPVKRLFAKQREEFRALQDAGVLDPGDPQSVRDHFGFGGENLVGHLRYSTAGGVTQMFCHPQVRESNWPTKSLMVLGNFNMTNVGELKRHMVDRGQHPFQDSDTQVILEEIGFHLDEVHNQIYKSERKAGTEGHLIPGRISRRFDIPAIIRESARAWDGGYVIVGLVGNGDGFVMRDPAGIRPCFYVEDEEVIAFASERAPLMTVFGKGVGEVRELPPGHVASVRPNGDLRVERFAREEVPLRPCSFERIYFSRGNDPDIYRERKQLGSRLVPQILEAIDGDLERTVFSFIPNTAETGYYGMMDGLREWRRARVRDELRDLTRNGKVLSEESLDRLISSGWPRGEKVATKDEKFRTFISKEKGRDELVAYAYDITYGVVNGDNLVAIDDSIVRGTTLRESILHILSRTAPRKIVIASSAPQIRYPDCYGIDMSQIGKFLAFKAAISLLRKRSMEWLIEETYQACLRELEKPVREMGNRVQAIYEPFTPEELSAEMARQVYPTGTGWDGEVILIFQTIENLHAAVPNHRGDWYFTGNYPTPGGYAVVNRAFVDYHEGRQEDRSYETAVLAVKPS